MSLFIVSLWCMESGEIGYLFVRRLPRITYPDVSHGLRSQISPALHHILWQVALLGLILVLGYHLADTVVSITSGTYM